MTTPIVGLDRISKRFVKRLDAAEKLVNLVGGDRREQIIHAVDQVSIEIGEGEVVGLVGESGCGKSTLGRVVAGIHAPSEGELRYRGNPVNDLKGEDAKAFACKVQMIFQDPMSSLNPRFRVRDIIGEAPRVHGLVGAGKLEDHVDRLLLRVGLDPSFKRRYPHQFSGGQRQRIGIARALA
ncbi:MAG: ATP-binding cassette domain-containing protein, partial [Nitrospirota bacterium]|nr:ATP-binding cassette domain-containing protein [Nitrospirota bacterium]